MFDFSFLFENIGKAILSDWYAELYRHDMAPWAKYIFLLHCYIVFGILNYYNKLFGAPLKFMLRTQAPLYHYKTNHTFNRYVSKSKFFQPVSNELCFEAHIIQ